MEASFNNTVGILVKAYLDGTLLKGVCTACAVGNICAASMGIQIVNVERGKHLSQQDADWSNHTMPAWQHVFQTDPRGQQYKSISGLSFRRAKEQIDATGYDWQDLARVEFAFETAAKGYSEEAEFAGLMAVVDVLADIHGVDLTATEAAKALFVKA